MSNLDRLARLVKGHLPADREPLLAGSTDHHRRAAAWWGKKALDRPARLATGPEEGMAAYHRAAADERTDLAHWRLGVVADLHRSELVPPSWKRPAYNPADVLKEHRDLGSAVLRHRFGHDDPTPS